MQAILGTILAMEVKKDEAKKTLSTVVCGWTLIVPITT